MNNTCPSPGCGAVYNLTPAHVGRSFTCKKCNAQLTVSASGLELSGPPQGFADPLGGLGGGGGSEQKYADEPAPPPRSRGRARGGPNPFAKLIESLTQDSFIWVVGVGLMMMVFFLFLPLLDQASVNSLHTKVSRLMQKNSREKDQEKLKKWREDDYPKLLDEVADAEDSAQRKLYWYRWGMMLAFFIVGIGGLAFLAHDSTIRRVVGAVLICGQVVVIVIAFVLASMGASEGRRSSFPPPERGGMPILEEGDPVRPAL